MSKSDSICCDVCLQEESLGGWKIKRNIDGLDKAEYTLDPSVVIRAGGKTKV